MKLNIAPSRIIVTFLVSMLVLGAALFGLFFNIFLDTPWDFRQPLIIAFWVVSTLIFLILTLTQNYYILEKKYVVVKRFNKELVYYFSDIIYIDEEKSEKKKVIYFFTRQGHSRYLTFDTKGILYKTMVEKCQNRLSKEEFESKYPDEKL